MKFQIAEARRSSLADAEDETDANLAEILSAAAEAFMTNGFTATSIDTVAELLGCTKGRIYYRFKSKADLFFAVHREAMVMNLEAITPVARGPGTPVVRLRGMIEAQAHIVMTRLPYQRVSVQGVELHLASSTTPAQRKVLRTLMDMRDQYEKEFVEVVSEGMRAGALQKRDPHFAVKPLLGALNWMTVWYRPSRSETPEARDRMAAELADLLIGGLVGTPA